jgi:hypothetical protein
MSTITELTPQFASQKSFYGKALVKTDENYISLLSYGKFAAHISTSPSKELTITHNPSRTTMRHLREFVKQYYAIDFDMSIKNVRKLAAEYKYYWLKC